MTMLFTIATVPHTRAQPLIKVGVLDFFNRVKITNVNDEQVKMFHIATDFLINELSDCMEIIDLTNDSIRSRIDEIYIQLDNDKIDSSIKDVVQNDQCEYIIYGFIMNCNVRREDKIIMKNKSVRVDMSVRILETATGKCVFTAKGTGISKADAYRVVNLLRLGQFELSEEELHSAIEDAIHKISDKIKKSI